MRLTAWLINILLLATLATLIYGYSLALAPGHVIDDHVDVLTTDQDSYRAGQQIFIHFDFCKDKDIVGTVYPELVGDSIVPMEVFTTNVKPGCYNTDAAVGFIPLHTPPGDYKLRLTTRYRVNTFKIVTYTTETELFTVGEGKIIYL